MKSRSGQDLYSSLYRMTQRSALLAQSPTDYFPRRVTLLPVASRRGCKVIPCATDGMTMPRHFRSFSSNSSNNHSNARKFMTGILYLMVISASLTGEQRLSQAESAKLSKESHFPNTLPLTSFYDAPHATHGKTGRINTIRTRQSIQYSL